VQASHVSVGALNCLVLADHICVNLSHFCTGKNTGQWFQERLYPSRSARWGASTGSAAGGAGRGAREAGLTSRWPGSLTGPRPTGT